MFVAGIALTVGAFFPEALKAKRLISDAVTNPQLTPDTQFSKQGA
jgi:hypothetical protein